MAFLQEVCGMAEQPAERQEQLDRMSRQLDRKIRDSERRAGRSLEDLEVLLALGSSVSLLFASAKHTLRLGAQL